MIFKSWFGYFEYVSYFPCAITLMVLSWCLDLIAINFNWSTQLWSIIHQEISSTKLCKPGFTHLICHRTFSIHYMNLFLFFSCIFTFLEIIKHICQNGTFSSIFNIKMGIKISPILSFFKMHAGFTPFTIQS